MPGGGKQDALNVMLTLSITQDKHRVFWGESTHTDPKEEEPRAYERKRQGRIRGMVKNVPKIEDTRGYFYGVPIIGREELSF